MDAVEGKNELMNVALGLGWCWNCHAWANSEHSSAVEMEDSSAGASSPEWSVKSRAGQAGWDFMARGGQPGYHSSEPRRFVPCAAATGAIIPSDTTCSRPAASEP